MGAFEFFFSLFGLILGLAVAVVIGGLSDVFRERNRVPIGWLTPMMGAFVLIDLATTWVNTYEGLSEIEVNYGPFVLGIIVAGIYFFAASMVFPKVASDWPSLDEYYMRHRRYVYGGVLGANLGIVAMDAILHHSFQAFLEGFVRSPTTPLWWIAVIVLFVAPNKKVQIIFLGVLLLFAVYAIAQYWTPQ